MKILVINSGSSSIKFQLLQMPSEKLVCTGMIDRIGSKESVFKYHSDRLEINQTFDLKDHRESLKKIVEVLLDADHGVIREEKEIEVVGHRVVHGGNTFSNTTNINDKVKEKIQSFSALAPLHNPPNLEGILVTEEFFPAAKQVAVFDTAFHQTIPEKVKKYAIPEHLYTKHGIQVYGFHGISHKYVSEKAINYLKLKRSKIITIHLGNGCSMTAVRDGKSVDHSMGFSPSNGLIMGSRSGDIDHGIIFHLVQNMGYKLDEVNTMLTRKSGMLGLTGFMDLRDIEDMSTKGDMDCDLALAMNAYRIKKYIGAYSVAMNGLDAIVFTAGIGENSSMIRRLVCSEMDFLGIVIDDAKNDLKSSKIREINSTSSAVKILVIPTNEELEVAKQAFRLVRN